MLRLISEDSSPVRRAASCRASRASCNSSPTSSLVAASSPQRRAAQYRRLLRSKSGVPARTTRMRPPTLALTAGGCAGCRRVTTGLKNSALLGLLRPRKAVFVDQQRGQVLQERAGDALVNIRQSSPRHGREVLARRPPSIIGTCIGMAAGDDELLAVAKEFEFHRSARRRDQRCLEFLERRASAKRHAELRRIADPAEHQAGLLEALHDPIEHRATGSAIGDIDIERRHVARQARPVRRSCAATGHLWRLLATGCRRPTVSLRAGAAPLSWP
jgi:hypothetical protein